MTTVGPSLRAEPDAGPAHVAVVSFLASRVVPSGGFWVALAGGMALARVGERSGPRRSFGASIAAMLETVAIIGPLRFGVPLTQAVTAPLLGWLEGRGTATWLQMLVCGVLRLIQNTAQTAIFIWVLAGGLDAYAGTYDAIASRLGLSVGNAETLIVTAIGLLLWGTFASVVQVLVYRRGLARWDKLDAAPSATSSDGSAEDPPVEPLLEPDASAEGTLALRPLEPDASAEGTLALRPLEPDASAEGTLALRPLEPDASAQEPPPVDHGVARFDPRLLALVAIAVFTLLLASTAWIVLGGVALFLALAWLVSRPDPTPLRAGLAFTVLLAFSIFLIALVGGLGLEVALRRACRAALLVLTATWLRAAARAEGLRFVFRRALSRLRRVPSVPEAARVLDSLTSESRLAASGRAFAAALEDVPHRPLPFVDAVIGWVVRESRLPHTPEPSDPQPKVVDH